MSLAAPLRVPVEIRRDQRWFLLAGSVSVDELVLLRGVPAELEGPVAIAFHLPGDRQAIRCHARAGAAPEEVVGEQELGRRLRFLDLDQSERDRILAYVKDRLGLELVP